MSSMLRRLATFSARHRALVIGAWLVLLVGVGFASHAAGTKYSSTQNVPGSDSLAATDVMTRSFSATMSDSSRSATAGCPAARSLSDASPRSRSACPMS